MNSKRIIWSVVGLGGVGTLFAAATLAQGPPVTSTSDVFSLPAEILIPGSSSELRRIKAGVTMSLDTSGLQGIFTIWWVVFNNPQDCGSSPCEMIDLFDEDVRGDVLGPAVGRIVRDDAQSRHFVGVACRQPDGSWQIVQ